MKNRIDYLKERQTAAHMLEELNRLACIRLSRDLRLNDEQKRICFELGEPGKDLLNVQFFDAVYRVLSLGKIQDRIAILMGSADDIDLLIARIQAAKGFYDDEG